MNPPADAIGLFAVTRGLLDPCIDLSKITAKEWLSLCSQQWTSAAAMHRDRDTQCQLVLLCKDNPEMAVGNREGTIVGIQFANPTDAKMRTNLEIAFGAIALAGDAHAAFLCVEAWGVDQGTRTPEHRDKYPRLSDAPEAYEALLLYSAHRWYPTTLERARLSKNGPRVGEWNGRVQVNRCEYAIRRMVSAANTDIRESAHRVVRMLDKVPMEPREAQ